MERAIKILLALNASQSSRSALDETASRSWPAGSIFDVVSVVEPSHLWTTDEEARSAAVRAQAVVQEAVDRLQKAGSADGVELYGDPKTLILDRARAIGADLVIVGAHGAPAITRFLLGDVAAAVLRHAPCSVEIVRAKSRPDGVGSRRVLLATEGSEYSEAAARSIADRPWCAGTEFRILSAVEMILPVPRAFFEAPFLDSGFLEAARGEAMRRAQDAVAAALRILAGTGHKISESISVLLEPPKSIILDEAARWGADLIVLGSHGRHGMQRFLLGSVSEAVATHAGCSVEVIRKR